jgi:hypothetical protein
VYHGFAVVFSGCLYTKSPIINERIDELNKYQYSMCRQCEYYYGIITTKVDNLSNSFFKISNTSLILAPPREITETSDLKHSKNLTIESPIKRTGEK